MISAEPSTARSGESADRARVTETLPPLPGLPEALEGVHGTFLELGAGYGVRLRSLYDQGRLGAFERVICTDLEADRVARAAALVPEAEALACNAERVPLESGSVDFAFSDQVIEHVPSDKAMAAEIARVLRPGGRAYVGSVLKRPWAWYFYRNGGHWRLEPTHLREYESLDDYRDVFASAGLTVDATYAEPMRFPVGEMILRALVRARLVPADSFYDVHAGSRLLRALSNVRFRIPGYFGCWVRAHKPEIAQGRPA